jgi:hypothetical protein
MEFKVPRQGCRAAYCLSLHAQLMQNHVRVEPPTVYVYKYTLCVYSHTHTHTHMHIMCVCFAVYTHMRKERFAAATAAAVGLKSANDESDRDLNSDANLL